MKKSIDLNCYWNQWFKLDWLKSANPGELRDLSGFNLVSLLSKKIASGWRAVTLCSGESGRDHADFCTEDVRSESDSR